MNTKNEYIEWLIKNQPRYFYFSSVISLLSIILVIRSLYQWWNGETIGILIGSVFILLNISYHIQNDGKLHQKQFLEFQEKQNKPTLDVNDN